jgi:hypothetical protein
MTSKGIAAGRREHCGRIPLGRDSTGERVTAARRFDARGERREIEYRDGVDVSLGDEESGAIGGERERIGSASLGEIIGWRIEEPAHHAARARVDGGDAIRAGGCCEESGAVS